MNCLCCGKPLPGDREQIGWHKACIKHFFGMEKMPEFHIEEEALELLAAECGRKGYTVAGVQKKLSLPVFSDGNKGRLTLVNLPAGYILKPQVREFKAVPEAEHLVMSMAERSGLSVASHALVRENGSYAYISRRMDCVSENGTVKRLAMEDFCQLDLRLTQDKYKGSYERCSKVIRRYSSRKELDMTELYMRLVFSFLVGNSDMHLKNFSLIETEEGSGQFQLAPAYDLLPVNVIMPEDTEEFALTMNGKKRNLRRKDFLIFAEGCGIPRSAAEKMTEKLLSMETRFLEMCEDSLLPEDKKAQFETLIKDRVKTMRKTHLKDD